MINRKREEVKEKLAPLDPSMVRPQNEYYHGYEHGNNTVKILEKRNWIAMS